MMEKTRIQAICGHGLAGDKAGQRPQGKRQVTLIQAEYQAVLASLLPKLNLCYADLRRNIAISGVNLNALTACSVQIGQARLEITGPCHPCGKLESRLGEGVFNALCGHGGLTARVIQDGLISLGDELTVIVKSD